MRFFARFLAFLAAIFMIVHAALVSPVSSRTQSNAVASDIPQANDALALLFADIKTANCHGRTSAHSRPHDAALDAQDGSSGGDSGEGDCQECKLRFAKSVPAPLEGFWLCESVPSGWVLEPRDQRLGRMAVIRPASRGPPAAV